MKGNRHAKILELISAESIDTQEGLLVRLKASGFDVTQATVSRDIRELGLHKVRDDGGKYRYVSTRSRQGVNMSNKLATIFTESVIKLDCAQNIVVGTCFTGTASAACASLDAAELSDVVGTLAGDDTFIIVTRDAEGARTLTERLQKLLTR